MSFRYQPLRVWVREARRQVFESKTPEGDLVILHTYEGSSDFREQILESARALRDLAHPGLVPVVDFGARDDGVFVAVRNLSGTPLSAFANGPHLDEDAAVEFITQAALTLEQLARVDAPSTVIAHGALEPGALMVSAEGRISIDGVGRTRLAERAGLLAPSASERLARYRTANDSDAEALALILCALLTGEASLAAARAAGVGAPVLGVVSRSLAFRGSGALRALIDDLGMLAPTSVLRAPSRVEPPDPTQPELLAPGPLGLFDVAAMFTGARQPAAPARPCTQLVASEGSSLPSEEEASRDAGDAPEESNEGFEATSATVGTQVSQLAGYRVLRMLASGTYGEIFLGERGGQRVAIKRLNREMSELPKVRRRLKRESEALMRIDHENVVRVLSVEEDGAGVPVIVLEYIDGKTLADAIREDGPFDAGQALDLVRQIARGLRAIHEADLVHRDLKPSNIMLQPSPSGPRMKILDFGMSRFLDSTEHTQITRAFEPIGSPGFMAPEQARRAARATPRADLYSLGAVAQAIISSKTPRAISADDPEDAALREALGRIIDRLLADDPEERHPSADAVLAALEPLHARAPARRSEAPRSSAGAPRPRVPAEVTGQTDITISQGAPGLWLAAFLGGATLLAGVALLWFWPGSESPEGRAPEPAPRAATVSEAPPPRAVVLEPSVPDSRAPDASVAARETPSGDLKPEPRAASTPRRPAPRRAKAASARGGSRASRFRAELRKHHLSGADLRVLERLVPEVKGLQTAPEAQWTQVLARASGERAFLGEKMSRVLTKMRRISGVSIEETRALEGRYFSLRVRLDAAGDSRARASINRDVTRLERDVERLLAERRVP